MKKLIFIFFLLIGVLNCDAQTPDYRDYSTGYYDCSVRHISSFVDYYSTHFMVTILSSGDSLINIAEYGNSFNENWDAKLKLNGLFLLLPTANYSYLEVPHVDGDSLRFEYMYFVQNHPISTRYICHKTAPLALEENTLKPKIRLGQSVGSITIIQPEVIVDRVKLYSIDGKEWLNEALYSTTNSINTSGLATGMYLLAFYKNNQFIDSKRVVLTY